MKRRLLDPYHAMLTGERPPNWWLTATNNWNAVCLAGVTGAGLVEIKSREERAMCIAAAETYSRHFLSGFSSDGYTVEGLGYWNYGFGHYVLLSQTIRQATDGKIDLLTLPEVREPAKFGARIQIINGISPAFADCLVNVKPIPALMYFLNHRFGLGLDDYKTINPKDTLGSLPEAMIYGFSNVKPEALRNENLIPGSGLRDWFDKAQVLITRPVPGSACHLGIAIKGGSNYGNHHHQDIGSYVVVGGERPVILDPGREDYTARTFSSHRFDSKMLNSYGHPVPIVANALQGEGPQTQALVIHSDFSNSTDSLQFDMTAAYPVPS